MKFSFELGALRIVAAIFFLLLWLTALIFLLKRTDLDGVTKICWVVVLCSLNLVGLVLYLIFGPQAQMEKPPISGLFEPDHKPETKDETPSSA